jgi:hypothetical protein
MNKKEFILLLDKYSKTSNIEFDVVDDFIVIEGDDGIHLDNVKKLPKKVIFRNKGAVWLNSITKIPKSTVFENVGKVSLNSITILPEDCTFGNKGVVTLQSISKSKYKDLDILNVGMFTTLLISRSKVEDYIVYYTKILQGDASKEDSFAYIAVEKENSHLHSYSYSVEEAVKSLEKQIYLFNKRKDE